MALVKKEYPVNHIRYLVKLENICENSSVVLIDTCALIGYLKNQYVFSSRLESIRDSSLMQRDSCSFYSRYFKNKKNIFLTQAIYNEFNPDGKKFFKKTERNISKEDREFNKRLDDICKEKRKLLRACTINQRIIDLTALENKNYGLEHQNYIFLMEKYFLTFADYNFLITGFILSKSRGKISLISNDVNLSKAWGHVVSKKDNSNKLKFFFRYNKKEFKELTPTKVIC